MPFESSLPSTTSMRTTLALTICLIAMAILPTRAEEPATQHDRLYKHTRMLIALAKVRNEKDAVILVASRPGKNSEVAEQFIKLGGEIHLRADDVDYLRGRLPVDKILTLAASPDVEVLDLDVNIDLFDPTTDFPEPPEQPSSTPPDPDTPLSHPYLPGKDMDITNFQAAHPTYDGRGVGMAILDATPDMLVPELQKATSLDGQPIRKISELLGQNGPCCSSQRRKVYG